MNFVIFIANLFGGGFLSQCLDLASSAVLIGSADVEDVVPHEPRVPSVDVCREDSPDNVPQVGLVVDVRQCRCYQYILLIGERDLTITNMV